MINEETILLLNFNGSNNSTTFIEETGKTIVANGDVKISTTQSVFGGTSGYFDGIGDYLSFDTQGLLWDFSLCDWTLECWVYPVDTDSRAIFMPRIASTHWPFGIYTQNVNKIYAYASGGAWEVGILGTTTLTLNTWNHVAFVRYKSNFYLFVNGVRDGVGNYSGDLIAFPSTTYIGKDPVNYSSDWKGYIDSFRLIKGRALYTENFTVPTEQFQYDPYYNNVSLLIPFDGPNNSTVFGDYSLNRNIITAYGDAKISTTQSKFGGSSGYFDGTGDYLKITDDRAKITTEDFTIECWLYPAANPSGTQYIWSQYWSDSSNVSRSLLVYLSTKKFLIQLGPNNTQSINTFEPNQWIHICWVRNGTSHILYINGNNEGNFTSSNYLSSSMNIVIGARNSTQTEVSPVYDSFFYGFIDELRIIKGFARYTENFTVPSQSFYKPYNYDPFIDNVSLLLHMDGDNTSSIFKDSSVNNASIALFGNAKISTTQSKIGGASGYFDGSGDYLELSSDNFDLTTVDFTIEAWVNFSSVSIVQPIFCKYDIATANNSYIFAYSGSINELRFDYRQDDQSTYVGNGASFGTVATNTWYHVAVTRSGNILKLFKNGILIGSSSNLATKNMNLGSSNCHVGVINKSVSPSYFNGYIDELRITKGVARYTGNFTPPAYRFYDLVAQLEYFYGVYNDYLICNLGESLGDYRSNSIVFTQEPMPFEDVEDGGTYFIEDYVTYNGAPASRRVDLYILQSRRLIRSVWSDPITGYYRFDRIKPQLYFVWCEDYLRVFDPVTHLVQVG